MSHIDPSKSSSTSPPLIKVLNRLSAMGSLVTTKRDGSTMAQCPCHEDKKQSLSITTNAKGDVIMFDHAGCETPAIVSKMGLTMAELFVDHVEPPRIGSGPKGTIAAVYPYTDEKGTLQYEAVRFEPKDFRQRRPDGKGGHVWNMQGATYYLYRLAELRKKVRGRQHPTAYIPEGEKDADRLWAIGLPAATNVGGAGKWRPEYTQQLVAAKVQQAVLFPDNDDPGRKHAEKVGSELHEVGIAVKVVHLPVVEKGDVSDYLAEHSKEELFALIKATAVWTEKSTSASSTDPTVEPATSETAERPRFPDFTDITYPDLFYGANEKEEPLNYHWDKFVVCGSVATILGAKKHTKTWFADLLAASAAAQEPIFPGFPYGGERVLLISGPRENSDHETKRRLRAIHQQYGITPGDGGEIRVRSYRRAAMRLDKADDALFAELCAYVLAFQPNMIRLDSSGALWGGKNESDNSEVREWMERRLDPLLQHAAPGCTLYLLAHTGHAIRDGKQTFASRHQRGASGWGDTTDTLLMVEKVQAPEGSPDHHVVSTIGMEYTRLGPETPKKIQLTISGGPGTGHDLGVALDWVAPTEVSQTDTEKALRLAVEALQAKGEVTQSELKKILKGADLGRNVGREALFVLRGSAPWTAGQYKGTKRALVREEGTQNNSPVMVWIGHSGDMWSEPENEYS